MDINFSHYDDRRTWEDTTPGWYKHTISVNREKVMENCTEIIQWLYNNIDNCERHARWDCTMDYVKIKFRHERDCLLARLRW